MWIVECKVHGYLGEVVEASSGLGLFNAHVKLMQDEAGKHCGSCHIYPKEETKKFKYPTTLE